MPVRAVVFDVGNVLYRWNPRFLFQKLIPDPEARARFLDEVVTLEWHEQHDAGRPLDEIVAERIARFPEHKELIDAYVGRWLETIPGPVEGTLELVDKLAAKGVPLFAITNFGTAFWERFRPTAPVLTHFREIVVSGEVGMIKPDPAIFRLARERFGLGRGEGIFIDDVEANARAAGREGFIGHHFRDAETLRAELERLALL